MHGFRWNCQPFYEADKGGAGGGGNGQGGNGDADAVLQGLGNLLSKHDNDADSVAKLLYRDNYELRERVRTLKDQLPADGAAILSGDEAAAWQAYQALGAPDTLATTLQEKDQLQSELATLRRASVIREAADAAGYKAGVLTRLDRDTLSYEIREEEQDGQTIKVAFVREGEADAVPLAQYAEAHWADFLPALAPAENWQLQSAGTPYPRQGAGDGAPPKTNLARSYIENAYRTER